MARTGRTVPSLIEVSRSDAFLDPALKPRRSRVFLDAIPDVRRLPKLSTWPEIEDALETILESGIYGAVQPEQVACRAIAVTRPLFARAAR